MLPFVFRLSRDQLHQPEEQQHDCDRAHQARGDHVLRLEAARVLLVVGALAHAEEAPEHRLEGIERPAHDAPPGASKNVYETDSVVRFDGASPFTRNTTGITRSSPGASVWLVKQKHSVFSM